MRLTGFGRDSGFEFEGGVTLDKDFGHLDHGYCSTSYASQGRTVDTVIASMGQESTPAIYGEQFYVTVSRGKQAVRIYTDDAQAIRQAVGASAARASALELIEGSVAAKLKPAERKERLANFTMDLARTALRLARQRGLDISIDKDLLREARSLTVAEHEGRVRDAGREHGD